MKKPLSKKAKARKAQLLKRHAAKPRKPHAHKQARATQKPSKAREIDPGDAHAGRPERDDYGRGADGVQRRRDGVPILNHWPARAAFAAIVLHVPGKSAGRALCGADKASMPAADPAMFGPLVERLEVSRAVAGELAAAAEMAHAIGAGEAVEVEVCGGCNANLQRMIAGDAKKLEAFRGRPSEGAGE